MSIAQRTAETTWEGSLAAGGGKVGSGSGALNGLDVTCAARTESPDGKTSPEELAAADHASCFAMALSLKLGERHTEQFQQAVDEAAALCPVSRLFAGAKITIPAALAESGSAA